MHHQEQSSQQSSPTGAMIDQLALYGAMPAPGETDHRPIPQGDEVEYAVATLFEASMALFTGSQLEDNLEEFLWSMTNIFHRRLTHIQKRMDDNDMELRELLSCQDGSEVKSSELERVQSKAASLHEHANSFEQMRDLAAEHFRVQTGSIWMPRTGSRVSNSALTASVVDSKSYLAAKRRKKTETLCPEGTRIAFSGGDYQDHEKIWKVLDSTKQKYPDMILLHGGTPKGAELIASKWADSRNITQVVFKPDWVSHGKAAPFKRNDKLLDTVPHGLIATPGTGITENLVDKARKLGIKTLRIGE